MEMKELVIKYKDYVQELRREFHQHPELSYEEVETTKRIAAELDKMKIPYQINPEKNTGIVAVIKGDHPGKAVGLRADIDALNVKEKNTFSFASKVDGKMHACGHDGHMAILLGAARMLLHMRDEIHGTVYLIFQPAEEVGSGASYMMRFGDWYKKIDNIFGAHVWIDLKAGQVSVEAGPRLAAADSFKIKVIGQSGHGSQPQQTIDATLVASAIVMNLQSIVSRHYSPLHSVVVTVGSLHSGNRFNIISGIAEMEGTCRYFDTEVANDIDKIMKQIIENTAAAYGAKAELDYDFMLPATINEESSSRIAINSVKTVLGKQAVTTMIKTMGGEDFAFYLQNKPGCFAMIGICNPEIGANYSHHNEHFNMDDSVLSGGSGVYAQYAIDYLKNNRDDANKGVK